MTSILPPVWFLGLQKGFPAPCWASVTRCAPHLLGSAPSVAGSPAPLQLPSSGQLLAWAGLEELALCHTEHHFCPITFRATKRSPWVGDGPDQRHSQMTSPRPSETASTLTCP